MQRQRKRGVQLGAKPKWIKHKEKVKELRAQGLTLREISERIGLNFRTVKKCLTTDREAG